MVPVEATVLIPESFAFQLVWPCQRHVVPYLHENLIQQAIQGGEICHPP